MNRYILLTKEEAKILRSQGTQSWYFEESFFGINTSVGADDDNSIFIPEKRYLEARNQKLIE